MIKQMNMTQVGCIIQQMEEIMIVYQIIKDMNEKVPITESTLYPILKRLESAGFLTVYSVEHQGRLRKFYAITMQGRQKIQDFIENWKDVMDAYQFITEGWNDHDKA